MDRPSKTNCWYVSPTGYCGALATRFFISRMKRSDGITPINRAVCDKHAKMMFSDTKSIQEVTFEEWIVAEVMSS